MTSMNLYHRLIHPSQPPSVPNIRSIRSQSSDDDDSSLFSSHCSTTVPQHYRKNKQTTTTTSQCPAFCPTEAQLRWAQFHKSKRRMETREKVERLMICPVSEKDVDGAVTEDGDSSSSGSSGSECGETKHEAHLNQAKKRKKKKKDKVKISRGRRALLRVSKRAYEERKRNSGNRRRFLINETQEEELELDHTHATASILRSRRIRCAKDDEDLERVRRFEEAYQVMMQSTTIIEHDDISVSTSGTKRWKRLPNIASAVSVDGRQYDDLQRAPTIRYKRNSPRCMQYDGTITPENLVRVDPRSPGHEKFQELLTKLQESANSNKSLPAPRKDLFEKEYAYKRKLNFAHEEDEEDDQHEEHEEEDDDDDKDDEYDHYSYQEYEKNEQNQSPTSNSSQISHPNENAKPPTPPQSLPSRSPLHSLIPPPNISTSFSSSEESYSPNHYSYSNHQLLTDHQPTPHISTPHTHQLSPHSLQQLTTLHPIIDSDQATDINLPYHSLSLSPTILNKRLRQAIKAIQTHQWDKVSYLLNANPWLAEMVNVLNSQLLLHQLALEGSTAPMELMETLMERFPKGVEKFDVDGNLPIHMAARSGNVEMLMMLGDEFEGGASVRNNEGLLPLHLAVLSKSVDAIEVLLRLFPSGVGVVCNEGNLPLHFAARLTGDVGAGIVYRLLDEDEGVKVMERESEESVEICEEERVVKSGLAKNGEGDTPLAVAVKWCSGWEVVEALMTGSGGEEAAAKFDSFGNNILHTLLSPPYTDPASTLAILKTAPHLASIPNSSSLLPIEIACLHSLPREVILGLVLVDLPIDLDYKESPKLRDNCGATWWFLACDCDDEHHEIIQEILSLCSYHQTRELCFWRGIQQQHGSVISRATPKCKRELRKALRFVGRYEFMGSKALKTDLSVGLKVFDALDFGSTSQEQNESGKRVLLKCFGMESSYRRETVLLDLFDFNVDCVEEVCHFAVHEFQAYSSANAPRQYCVAVERPDLTLARVVSGMPKNHEYRQDPERLARYLAKVCMVLRLIGKAVKHLHDLGVVHGDVGSYHCGKFGEKWKLMSLTGVKRVGEEFTGERMGEYSPPESVQDGRFIKGFEANVSMDIWAFGKLIYEVLAGEPLIELDAKKKVKHDADALTTLETWDETSLSEVVEQLTNSGVGPLGVDLVSHCLCPRPEDRPGNMEEVLKHPFWKDVKRRGKESNASKKSKRNGGNKRG